MTSGFKSFVAPPPFTTVHYQAMESGGVGLSKKAWSLPDPLVGSWKTLAQLGKEEFDVLTLECEKLSMFVLLEGLGQRCPCALQCWLLLCVETKFLVRLTLQCSASHSCSLEQSSTTREGCRNKCFTYKQTTFLALSILVLSVLVPVFEVTKLRASCKSPAMFGSEDLHRGDVGFGSSTIWSYCNVSWQILFSFWNSLLGRDFCWKYQLEWCGSQLKCAMFPSFSSLVVGLPGEPRLVAPLAAAFDVMEGSKEDQAAVFPKKH